MALTKEDIIARIDDTIEEAKEILERSFGNDVWNNEDLNSRLQDALKAKFVIEFFEGIKKGDYNTGAELLGEILDSLITIRDDCVDSICEAPGSEYTCSAISQLVACFCDDLIGLEIQEIGALQDE